MLTVAILLACAPQVVSEDFDQPGASWSATLFPMQQVSGGGSFAREDLATVAGAPNTTPPLPIHAGGDKEGRYFEQGTAFSHSVAYGGVVRNDARIDGYVGIAFASSFGSRSVGFLLRSGSTPFQTAYAAIVNHNSGSTATLDLARMCNGLITVSDVLASSQAFPVDLDAENYRLIFTAQGEQLTAVLLRVRVVAGVVVEEPIDLLPAPGVQGSLQAQDGTLAEGVAGVYAFARGANSVLWDDVEIADLGGELGLTYCSGDGAAAPCPCGNATQAGEGCRTSLGVGARLAAQGGTSVAADDLRLAASQVPRLQPGVLFAGTAPVALPLFDGLRCVGGATRRLPAQSSGPCGVLVQSGVAGQLQAAPGETWHFQGWFRDPGGPCATAANLTHGLSVTFGP